MAWAIATINGSHPLSSPHAPSSGAAGDAAGSVVRPGRLGPSRCWKSGKVGALWRTVRPAIWVAIAGTLVPTGTPTGAGTGDPAGKRDDSSGDRAGDRGNGGNCKFGGALPSGARRLDVGGDGGVGCIAHSSGGEEARHCD